MPIPKRVGVARVLSKLGYCSRSQAVVLIRDGRVSCNGRLVRDPETPIRAHNDKIAVDGRLIEAAPAIYLELNKPRGVVTSASDEQGRHTVYNLLDPDLPWVGPVGRLDKASEGLILLTNDSAWAAKINDPTSHLEKKYHVQIDRVADDDLIARLVRGVEDRGKLHAQSRKRVEPNHSLRAKAAKLIRQGHKNSWLEITLDEGKNRQIRRLLESQDIDVLRLVRVAIGPLELGTLKKGHTRSVTSVEKAALDKALYLSSLSKQVNE